MNIYMDMVDESQTEIRLYEHIDINSKLGNKTT